VFSKVISVTPLHSQYRFTFAYWLTWLYLLGYRSFEFRTALPALADPSYLFGCKISDDEIVHYDTLFFYNTSTKMSVGSLPKHAIVIVTWNDTYCARESYTYRSLDAQSHFIYQCICGNLLETLTKFKILICLILLWSVVNNGVKPSHLHVVVYVQILRFLVVLSHAMWIFTVSY